MFYSISVTHLAWSARIREELENVASSSMCLARCHLIFRCDFYVYIDNKCFIGDAERIEDESIFSDIQSLSQYGQSAPNSEYVIHYFFNGRGQSNYQRDNTVSNWQQKIYRSISITEGLNEAKFNAQLYCEAICVLDLAMCYIYAVDITALTCHLGAHHVDTGLAAGINGVPFVKMSNTLLIHGGRNLGDGWDLDRQMGFEIVTEGRRKCHDHGFVHSSVGTTGDHQPSHHSMTFAHPYLVMCAVTTSPVTNFECFKLDVSADQREWESIPRPALMRTRHIMMAHNNQVFLIGGASTPTSECGDMVAIDRFDLGTNTWSLNVAQLPLPASDFCAAQIQNKIWIILGGRRCAGNSAQAPQLHILDPLTLTWEFKGQLPGQESGNFGMVCGLYYTPDNHEWLVMTSGRSADAQQAYLYEIYYLDTTINGEWHLLSSKTIGGADVRGPDGLVSLTRRDLVFFDTDSHPLVHLDLQLGFRGVQNVNGILDTRVSPAQVSLPLHLFPTCIPRTPVWVVLIHHNSATREFIQSPEAQYIQSVLHVQILEVLEPTKCIDGSYHLRLIWWDLGHFNEWVQTSSPLAAAPVQGYRPISVHFPNQFEGLCAAEPGVALMTGKSGTATFLAGASRPMEGTTSYYEGPVLNDGSVFSTFLIKFFIKRQSC